MNQQIINNGTIVEKFNRKISTNFCWRSTFILTNCVSVDCNVKFPKFQNVSDDTRAIKTAKYVPFERNENTGILRTLELRKVDISYAKYTYTVEFLLIAQNKIKTVFPESGTR